MGGRSPALEAVCMSLEELGGCMSLEELGDCMSLKELGSYSHCARSETGIRRRCRRGLGDDIHDEEGDSQGQEGGTWSK